MKRAREDASDSQSPKRPESSNQVEADVSDDMMEEVIVDPGEVDEDELKVWDPRKTLPDDHNLVKNNLCYTSFHEFSMRESCYSVQPLNDKWTDGDRTTLPYSMYGIAGTQAVEERQNAIILFKVEGIGFTQADELDSDDSIPDEYLPEGFEVPTERVSSTPDLQTLELPHPWGMVNKVRAHPNMPRLVASFSSDNRVCLWDIEAFLEKMQNASPTANWSPTKPKFTFEGHQDEGYALAWETSTARLATGDNSGIIHLWEPGQDMNYTVSDGIQAHDASVEDISWKIGDGQSNIFVTCSSDSSFKLWDMRVSLSKCQHQQSNAHDGDVNISQFNPHLSSSHLIATGGDDYHLKIWDMRAFGREGREALANHQIFHKSAISSIAWNPHERSVLASSGYDDMICIWDLSVENAGEKLEGSEFPEMLQFIHCGQTSVSDVAWHPYVPGLILSTGQDEMNIFKPFNL
eukprot:GHVH01005264.1.p1 GENE.GHVH01005264.1~~GHVH01005264.1.p1  ORF type:complete len:463 (-),score=77.20 GHVH01005264.1:871-2259(-)